MLNDFFSINLPYGIAKNENGEWMAFNREYRPVGYNANSLKKDVRSGYLELPVYTKYKKISEKVLLEIADGNTIERDEEGNIHTIFLYNDGSNPKKQSFKSELWTNYFKKLEKLSKLEITR